MFSQPVRENLLALADAYRSATGLSMATISARIHGKRSFFDDLRSGEAGVHLKNVDPLLQKFSDHWPAGVPWPRMRPVKMARPRKSVDERPNK